MSKIEIKLSEFIKLDCPSDKLEVDNLQQIEIEQKEICIEFKYPLGSPVVFNFPAPNSQNFTKENIIDCIFDGYKEIYSDTEKYKIHSHYLNQLFIEGIEYNQDNNIILLEIGS